MVFRRSRPGRCGMGVVLLRVVLSVVVPIGTVLTNKKNKMSRVGSSFSFGGLWGSVSRSRKPDSGGRKYPFTCRLFGKKKSRRLS